MHFTDRHGQAWLTVPHDTAVRVTEAAYARADASTAAMVEQGLRILDSHGLQPAAHFACDNRVPLHVALRVLLRPWARRGGRHGTSSDCA